jgi:hypothetical protein
MTPGHVHALSSGPGRMFSARSMIAPRPLLTVSVAAQVVVAWIESDGLGSV